MIGQFEVNAVDSKGLAFLFSYCCCIQDEIFKVKVAFLCFFVNLRYRSNAFVLYFSAPSPYPRKTPRKTPRKPSKSKPTDPVEVKINMPKTEIMLIIKNFSCFKENKV